MENNRAELAESKRIVVKVGTSSLAYPDGSLNLRMMERIAWVLTDLRNRNMDILLVSSGAIGVGAERLGLKERPRDIKLKQAAAAVGQAALMQIYQNFFMEYNQKVAQILLTKDVIEIEARKTNAQNTLESLLDMKVIPIVNENDTISTDEIEFSDNDTLSAYVSCLVGADLLIILTDTDGLYPHDPKKDSSAVKIDFVDEITDWLQEIAGGAGSLLGTGGMASKVAAAKIVTEAGINVVVANGHDPNIINDILEGKNIGTLFKKAAKK